MTARRTIPVAEFRVCRTCGVEKALHHFRVRAHGKVYYRMVCHACRWYQWRAHVEQRECRRAVGMEV